MSGLSAQAKCPHNGPMEKLTLTREQDRVAKILDRVVHGSLAPHQACEFLGLCDRQLRRKVARYRLEGTASVIHGNTGRPPSNKTSDEAVATVLQFANDEKLEGITVSHLRDFVAENSSVSVSRSTVERVLVASGQRAQPKSPRPHRRRRRLRRAAAGELLQLDASKHAWLGADRPQISLVGAIDDATGAIMHLHFRPTEDQEGYVRMLRDIAFSHGLPEAVYHDRHTILKSPKPQTIEDELNHRLPMSQIQDMLDRIGIEQIIAYSPEAKGRIERLWGTLQERLTTEMRYAHIETMEAANEFLPAFIATYNERFMVKAREPETAWVEMADDQDVDYLFSVRDQRVLSRDTTIRWHGHHLQIVVPDRSSLRSGATIQVHVTPENEVFLYNEQRQRLAYRLIEPPQAQPRQPARQKPQPPTTTPEDRGRSRRKVCGWLFAGVRSPRYPKHIRQMLAQDATSSNQKP